ncbi:MAG TPA: EamA family transporter [Tepidisphaeraceae bacterium]|jgi:transporter family protein|nr:EamA family transporter [Tepidisphaeraceae bacterium]
MADKGWLFYALLAAVSAAFVSIFAKIGMEGINSTVATTVRSAVMLVFLLAICTGQELWGHLPKIRGWAVVMIALSGIAGATSWLFGFKALAVGGKVTQVAPIDKLSVPLAAVLAFCLLRDRPAWWNWAGIILIAFGAYLTALPQKADGKLRLLPDAPTNHATESK